MEIQVYLNERLILTFKSPCIPRQGEEIVNGGSIYKVKQVFYNVRTYNTANSEVNIIGLEVIKIK